MGQLNGVFPAVVIDNVDPEKPWTHTGTASADGRIWPTRLQRMGSYGHLDGWQESRHVVYS